MPQAQEHSTNPNWRAITSFATPGRPMITRDEIDEAARELDLSVSNVERDYVFGWLISGIYQATPLGDTLVLKGGNALRKGYFPLTRFSDDLDFSTDRGLDRERLLGQLNDACRFTEDRTGVAFDLDRNVIADERQIDKARRVYKVRLYFKDFANQGEHITLKIRMDVTEYDRLHLPVRSRRLIHQYSDAADCSTDIRVVALEEALADKLKCLLQRRYCFDLFDTVYAIFIARELDVDRSAIMDIFLRKTIFRPSPVAAKNLLLGLPFELYRGFWDRVVCPLASRLSFDAAVQQLSLGIEDLFGPYNQGQHFEAAFFPAEFRNPILQAGQEKRLLEMRYHGATRQIEPYALIFKRRQDGGAREYFYAYDRSGGLNSGPGIKSFVATDVQSLTILDEAFEPRFEIELAKAGDADTADYFRGSPGVHRLIGSPRLSRRPRSSAKYVVECSYCGKKFYRQSYSTQLNAHKDKYGNRCFGRFGMCSPTA